MAGHILRRIFREAVYACKFNAAHSLYTNHNVDKQRLLASCFGVYAELLPERYIRHQSAEDASSGSSGLALEPEGLETELDDVTKAVPGVDGIRANSLCRNGDDLVVANEVLGQRVTRITGHYRLREKKKR
jgi:hypothetical protein